MPGPAAPRLIQRRELLASLDRATEAKVTVVSAPAGSGKTCLLRAWADGPGRPYRLAVVQVGRDQQDSLAALGPELAATAEIANARAAICLAEANPAAALAAVQDVLNGIAPANGYATVVEANILAAIAHRGLGDQCAATIATEGALALAEADRLVLPFA